MIESTFTFKGHHFRLDQIQSIEPLNVKTHNIDGWTSIFMKTEKLNMQSQYNFAIWFVGEKGGYREFYSKVVDYQGSFKGDEDFECLYQDFVTAWKKYHNHEKEQKH
ncbi:MAG: hypothetical protein R3182_13130 [Draconibacterium sp.]|nr:hypothetical protein [Draconibacterium sp.]